MIRRITPNVRQAAQAYDSDVAEPSSRSTARAVCEVGVLGPHYNLQRVSYGLPVEGYRFRRVRRLPLHVLERRGTFWNYTPILVGRVPLIHTFNALPVNGRRFIVSCELELPRYLGCHGAWQQRIGTSILESRRCRRILMLSEAACARACADFRRAGRPDIVEKITLFRGGVPAAAVPHEHDLQNTSRALRLLFVGRDGLRKGLLPVIDAVQELRHGGLNLQLTVVSTLDSHNSYVFREFTPDIRRLRKRVLETSWIHYHEELRNSEIREQMQRHDLFVLPSFDESLGWVFVEAAFAGIPCIATNVFAIPELIDDGITGRTIALELNQERRWAGLFLRGGEKHAAIGRANIAIQNGLKEAIPPLFCDRQQLARWGIAARRKMESMYDVVAAGRRLQELYDAALA